MRVGVVRQTPWSHGGGFQYESVMLEALAAIAAKGADELFLLTDPDSQLDNLVATGKLNFAGLPLRCVNEPRLDQLSPFIYIEEGPQQHALPDPNSLLLNRVNALNLRRVGVDWLFNLSQTPFGFESRVPFVMPIHDLQHRLQSEFPEVSAHGQIELREYLYRNACRYATLLLVDSTQGRDDVLRFYGDLIDEERIRILPFYPPTRAAAMPTDEETSRIAKEYNLPPRFFFYPAQFWRHKNHHLIVQALHLIKEKTGAVVPVVLCGSYADSTRAENFVDMGTTALQLGVFDQIRYIGWLPDSKIPALYRLSVGLVMPTFFGPTNIPALEAWHFGRPVITSDIPGIREQTGDAGLLVDPRSPEQLADAMLRLWQDDALAATLVERGRARLAAYNWNDFVIKVADIVEEAGARLRGGLSPRYPD